jgi:hypothetical protein
MGEQVAALSGVLVVGIHAGVQGDAYPKLVVQCPDRETGQLRVRQIEVRAYSPQTGEPTRVGKDLAAVKEGDRIAVGVYTDVRNFIFKTSTSKHQQGEAGQMVTFSAMWVQALPSDF